MSASADDPYRVLKVRRTSTLAEIKIARKRWELKLHPDKQEAHASDEFLAKCAERLAAVRASFALIGTEDARAAFDAAWAEAHPAAAVEVMEADEDEEVMEASEFWSGALHSLAVVLMTAAAGPVLANLALADALADARASGRDARGNYPLPSGRDVAITLTMLAAAFLALTAPLRLAPSLGLRVANFVLAAAAAMHYPVHDYVDGAGFLLGAWCLTVLCFPRATLHHRVLLCGVVVAPIVAMVLWFAALEPTGWLVHTWALLGVTYALLFIPAAQDLRKSVVLPLCLGALVGFVSRLRMCGVTLESSNALDLLEQCAGSTAVGLLAAKASTTWLLVLDGLFFILLALLTSSSIPYQEPLEVAKPRIEPPQTLTQTLTQP